MVSDPDPTREGIALRDVLQVEGGVVTSARDFLAEEVPLAVHYNGEAFAVMMVSPGDFEDFAYGFSLTEVGLTAAEIVSVQTQELLEGIRLDIRTAAPLPERVDADSRRLLPGRTGCGVCGNRQLEDVLRQPARVDEGRVVEAAALGMALRGLHERQRLNIATGATHAAAWAGNDGQLHWMREDVGRHNALDKMIGALLRAGADPRDGFAVVTSRASYEMVTKAATAGIGMLVAISAPTALAVDLANSCGLTLAGFVRSGRHVIYSHPWRLQGGGL